MNKKSYNKSLPIAVDESGVASMMTVIIVSIVIITATLGILRLALIGGSQSIDADLAARAYFAADSGVEDAQRALRQYQADPTSIDLHEDTCDYPEYIGSGPAADNYYSPELAKNGRFETEITCVLIEQNGSSYKFTLDEPNQKVKIPVEVIPSASSPGNNFDELLIEWHLNRPTTDSGDGEFGSEVFYRKPTDADKDRLLSQEEWVDNRRFPALMEIGVVSHPINNFSESDFTAITTYLNPVAGSTRPDIFTTTVDQNGALINASCVASATQDYLCSASIRDKNNFPNSSNYILELSNLYRATQVKITPKQNGIPKAFRGGQVTIDVTARAGEAYRRVRVEANAANPAFLPDSTVTTTGDVCKNFTVTAAGSNAVSGTSCQ